METKNSTLTARVLNATTWNYLGTVGRITAQTVSTIILARILGPEAFGIFAITLLITGICTILADMGLGNSLIQRKDLVTKEVQTIFLNILLFASFMGLSIFFLAPVISDWFDNQELVLYIRASSLYILFFAFGVVPSSLLKKELYMKQVQLSQLTSYVVGFLVIGLGCALLGVGALSLILALISQALINSTMVFKFSKFKPELKSLSDISTLRKYGYKVTGNNISNWVTENMDNMLIGKFFGVSALGSYSVSYNLLRTPTNHIVVTLQSVLFSAASKSQDEPEKLVKAYLAVSGLVALVCFPIFFTAASMSDVVILGLYGSKWESAIPLFIPLALSMPFHALMAIAGPIVAGKGDVHRELKVQFGTACLFLVLIMIAAQLSLVAVAWAVFVTYVIRLVWMTSEVKSALGFKVSEYIRTIAGGFILACLTCGLTYIISFYFISHIEGIVTKLILVVFISTLVLLSTMFFLKNHIYSEKTIWMLTKIFAKLPNSINSIGYHFFPINSSNCRYTKNA